MPQPIEPIVAVTQALLDLNTLELPPLTPGRQEVDRLPVQMPQLGALPPLPSPEHAIMLPAHSPPWKILVVDDDAKFLADLNAAASAYRQAIDVRTLLAKFGINAAELGSQLRNGEWKADLLVLDVHLSRGGISSAELLDALRAMPGYRALPVVAATGNRFGQSEDEESDETSVKRAQFVASTEGLLWSKGGNAMFLQRICENMDFWRQTARRRAWSVLLQDVSRRIDDAIDKDLRNVATRVDDIAAQVVEFIHRELGPVSVYLRWREEDNSYRLVRGMGHEGGKRIELLNPNEVPILNRILSTDANQNEEVWQLQNDGIAQGDAGRLEYLKTRRFLGARITLGKRTYGFLTLTRDAAEPPFDADVDPQQLGLLVRVLASSLGRIETLSDIRHRQQQLLGILSNGNKPAAVSEGYSRQPICQEIVDLLHRALHAKPSAANGTVSPDNQNGKVTCRLVDFATGDLVPKGAAGFGGSIRDRSRKTISIKDHHESIIAYVIHRSNDPACADDKKFRWNDVRDVFETQGRFKDNDNRKTKSELCVPIRVGQHTIGALNLEHTSAAFYTQLDEEFVLLVAQSLGQLLSNLTAQRFQSGLLDFAHQFLEAKPTELYVAFQKVLHQLCGHSMYADLEPDPSNPNLPWRATSAKVLLTLDGTSSVRSFLDELNEILSNDWSSPKMLFSRLWREKQWQHSRAYFTADPDEFAPTTIAKELTQRADAVLWVCKDEASAPHRAMLLLWGLPPPIGPLQVEHMDRLMHVFAGIEAFNDKVRSLLEQRALGEQYEALGHVLQHFRHRLKQNTSNLASFVELTEWALEKGDVNSARSNLADIKKEVDVITQGFHESRGYVKQVRQQEHVGLFELVKSVAQDASLKRRMAAVNFHNLVPRDMECRIDPVIAKLILYSVVENALDAIAEVERKTITVTATLLGPKLALRIADNGPGISTNNRAKLFNEVGFTTKGGGLGSALPFARIRARQMGADISLDESVTTGACFLLTLPAQSAT